jgi:hypothetical protein
MKKKPKNPRWKQVPKFADALKQIFDSMTRAELRRALLECELMTTTNVGWQSYALRGFIAEQCKIRLARTDRRHKEPPPFPL